MLPRIYVLSALFVFICTASTAQPSVLKDDSLAKQGYLNETTRKKDQLIAALPSDNARDYKKVYNEHFNGIGSFWKSRRPITAPLANDYLQQVVQQITKSNPQLATTDARVVFTRDWWPNAVSMGDGTIGINAGLLIYLQDEAQLAFIISHELAHYYLQHTPSAIKKYVERVTSREYQAELKRLSKTQYGANRQLEELSKTILFSSRKHSRDNEAAADATAFHFMKNSGYNLEAVRTALGLLDAVDDTSLYKPIDPAVSFTFPGYAFQKKWIEQESSIFSQMNESDSPLSKKEKDSLKTHPDCLKRIELLSDSLKQASAGKNFVVNETLFRDLKRSFLVEIEEECYRQDLLDKNLYYSLQLMQHEDSRQIGAYAVARNLNRMHELQKNHRLGLNKDAESKSNRDDYNLLLRFLDRIRLDQLASITYNFCKQQETALKNFPGFDKELKTAIANKN
jgi:Zn-dependent protease with chaperone function